MVTDPTAYALKSDLEYHILIADVLKRKVEDLEGRLAEALAHVRWFVRLHDDMIDPSPETIEFARAFLAAQARKL